ncbi:GTP cyclohydrolase I [Hydrogenophaga sp. XSHU_21]
MRDIRIELPCVHHLVPMPGVAHVACRPGKRVVRLSKIARVVDAFARRMQNQERLTNQIPKSLQNTMPPRGVALLIEAHHICMATRGVCNPGSTTLSQRWIGRFNTHPVGSRADTGPRLVQPPMRATDAPMPPRAVLAPASRLSRRGVSKFEM